MLYFSDTDEEVYFAITENSDSLNKKVISFMTELYGKEFEEVDSDWADEINADVNMLVIKVQFFNEDLLELIEKGVDIHIVK